jgi:hypothetical protein
MSKKRKISLDAHGGGLNWALVAGAVVTAFAPPIGLLAAGVAVTTSMWAGAGLSVAMALLAGNVKRPKAPADTDGQANG